MMGKFRDFWHLCLVTLILSVSCCCNLSEARHHHSKKPSAVVVGAVFCETCFQDDMSKGSHYISGATVAVECAEGTSRPAFYQEVKTDEQGKFKVQLPYIISKHVKKIEGCTVKLVKSSEPYCAVASTATSSLINLKGKKGGKHIFSAGFFTFKPLKQPGLCNQQPSVTNTQKNSLEDLFQNPTIPNIPTIPNPEIPTLPITDPPTTTDPNTPTSNWPNLPQLPSLPPLPKLPSLPYLPTFPETPIVPYKDNKVETDQVTRPQQFFPPLVPPILPSPPSTFPTIPNPLQPPPLVPNPFQPPAPPLIPNPFQPPSPPSTILPPLPPVPNLPYLPPGLIPTPSPPPPASSLPIPPIPFLPPTTPIIPGIPPLKTKKVNP